MIDLFLLLVINSLICVGLYKSWQFEIYKSWQFEIKSKSIDNDGNYVYEIDDNTKGIFWWYKYYFLDKIPYRLSKPFGNCLTCMASVWGVIPFFYHYGFTYWVFYPIYVLALAGLNSIFDKFVNE